MSGAVNLFGLTQAQFETFVLVLVRVSVILLMIPIFQSAEVNVRVRFGLGLAITFVVWHVVPPIAPLNGLGPIGGTTAHTATSTCAGANSAGLMMAASRPASTQW